MNYKCFSKNNGHKTGRFLSAVLCIALLLSACWAGGPSKPDGSGYAGENKGNKTQEPSETPMEPTAGPSSAPPEKKTQQSLEDVEMLLSRLTLEEKIGQMFFIASRTTPEGLKQLEVDGALKDTLSRYKPGGFIFFSENLDSIDQTVSFISSLQESASIPLFIGIDEEGGVVSRLNKAEKLHSTVMPAPYTIGLTENTDYAGKVSYAIAQEIASLGFNINFAPVADVFSNPSNKIIGRRAYSSDAEIASAMVAQAVKGYVKGGIIPVLKHFPGHGDTLQDSHTGAAVVENDIERLRKIEFLPFKAGIEAGAEVIMTAHVLTPQVTDDGLPATLSKQVIQGILREELGFEGLIITDGLEMSAISAFYPEDEAVVMAVEAGVDMLLLPKDLDKAYNAILTAVEEGKLSEQRIDRSVRRILMLKRKYMAGAQKNNSDPEKILGSKEHREIADQIKNEIP